MGRLLLAGLVLIAVAGQPDAKASAALSACEANKHVGEQAQVRGTVAQVRVSTKGHVFINFEDPCPAQCFYGFIFSDAAGGFGDVMRYQGKTCTVSGIIELYKGRPEIVLRQPQQIACER